MLSKEIKQIEQIKKVATYLLSAVDDWSFEYNEPLEDYINKTPYYTTYGHNIGTERINELDALEAEIKGFFLSLDDSKSQERYGRFLLEGLNFPIKYTTDLIQQKLHKVNQFAYTINWGNWPSIPRYEDSPEEYFITQVDIPVREERTEDQNRYLSAFCTLSNLSEHLNDWSDIINNNIKCFAPELLSEHENIITPKREGIEQVLKLTWSCKPAIAGYIISELVRAGYIEPPITNGELSYAKLATVCYQIFDFKNEGKSTTLEYLKKVVNSQSNSLPDHKRAKLKLPDLDQLS